MTLSRPGFRESAAPVGDSADGAAEGLYPISVVTEMTGVGARPLRGYERAGLLHPADRWWHAAVQPA